MRQRAVERLDGLFRAAVAQRGFYGRVAVEVCFENGEPVVIRRYLTATDHASGTAHDARVESAGIDGVNQPGLD